MTAASPDLTWRPMALTDARAWAALLNAIEAEDKIGGGCDEDGAAAVLADPMLDLARGTLAAFDGDAMVGFSFVLHQALATGTHRVVVSGGVRPDHRRRGIGTHLLRAGTDSAKILHTLHHPELLLAVDVKTGDGNTGARALYEANGMTPIRWYSHMEHPLGPSIQDAPIPAGFSVEAYRANTDGEFRDVRNEAFQDHWGSSRLSEEEWRTRMVNDDFRPELSFLLRDQATETAAGMLLATYWESDTEAAGIRDAYFCLIATRRAYRKRGVAAALVAHALRAAEEQGYGRASLEVDADNPSGALGLYERAGFVGVHTSVRYTIAG